MSSDNNVHPSHALGDVLIHLEAGVTQGDDLVAAQRLQLIDLHLKRLHLIRELQVRALEQGEKQDGLYNTPSSESSQHCSPLNIKYNKKNYNYIIII